jgi:hypothetical protein
MNEAANTVLINEAIPLYVGVGYSLYPVEDDGRVFERYGSELGKMILVEVKALIAQLNAIEADWENHSLLTGSQWAVDKLVANHKDLDDEAISALKWIYSWWFR